MSKRKAAPIKGGFFLCLKPLGAAVQDIKNSGENGHGADDVNDHGGTALHRKHMLYL